MNFVYHIIDYGNETGWELEPEIPYDSAGVKESRQNFTNKPNDKQQD